MKIIQNESKLFEYYIPKPQKVSGEYRPSHFLFWNEADSCVFHSLTRSIVFPNAEEVKLLKVNHVFFDGKNETVFSLIRNWFLVPIDCDETVFYQEVYALNTTVFPENEKKSLYKIFTTTACNARCYYCFEAGTPISSMSNETADQVIQYILATKHDKPIKLYWFGGEPLCNHPVISRICTALQEENIPFTSDMISNGLLFSTALISKAASLWNLQLCQITLDGTPEVYKRVKNYVSNDTNPFNKVIENIDSLLVAGISVRIRLNIDRSNIDDIFQLKDFLLERYSDKKNLSIYAAAISTEWLGYHDPTEPDRSSVLGEALSAIRASLKGKTEARHFLLSTKLPVAHCMANSRHAVVINPDGNLYTCQGCDEQMCYGHISTGINNHEVYEAWKHNDAPLEKCKDCVFLPECTSFSRCPSRQDNCKQIMQWRTLHRLNNTLENLGFK